MEIPQQSGNQIHPRCKFRQCYMNQQTRECVVERVLESFRFFDNLRFVNVSGFENNVAHIVFLNKV